MSVERKCCKEGSKSRLSQQEAGLYERAPPATASFPHSAGAQSHGRRTPDPTFVACSRQPSSTLLQGTRCTRPNLPAAQRMDTRSLQRTTALRLAGERGNTTSRVRSTNATPSGMLLRLWRADAPRAPWSLLLAAEPQGLINSVDECLVHRSKSAQQPNRSATAVAAHVVDLDDDSPSRC